MPKLRDSECASRVLTAGQWSGEPCFVVGGGPSVKDLDLSRIRGFHSVGANMAFLLGVEINYFIDFRAVELVRDRKEWSEYEGTVLIHPSIKDHKHAGERDYPGRIYSLEHIPKRHRSNQWPTSFSNGLIGMNNTGVMCVQIADLLGASPIFLIGFDMTTEGQGSVSTNWHEEYPHKWRSLGRQIYPRFVRSFQRVKEYAKAEIYNCNPLSGMNYFPKITFDDAFDILESRNEKDPHCCRSCPSAPCSCM